MLTLRGAVVAATLTLLAATTTSAAGAPAAVAPEAGGSSLAVTGFALGSLGPERLEADADALDRVTVAGIGLRADGGSVEAPTADMDRVRARADRHGLATELLVSNYSNRLEAFDPKALHLLLSSPDRIDGVARQVVATAVDGGWGGVNVDFELVRAADRAGLTAFVEAVDDRLGESMTLSIDVSAATSQQAYRQRGYQLGALGEVVDVLVLMTYDLHGPTWSGPGPIGDLRWQRKAIAAAAEVVPVTKIDMGVAGYGYTWPRKGTGRTVSPAGARRLVERDGVRATWHRDSGEWSATLRNGTRMWWSDGRSYRQRVRVAEQLGVHGLAVWRLGFADPLG